MPENKRNGGNGKLSNGQIAGISAGVAAAALSLAGAYYFYFSKDGEKNRKQARAWIIKAKKEVASRLDKMKRVDQQVYNSVIDAVAKKYKAVQNVDREEIATMVKELKGHWASISKQLSSAKERPSRKRVPKRAGK